jgi:hypothetical protein
MIPQWLQEIGSKLAESHQLGVGSLWLPGTVKALYAHSMELRSMLAVSAECEKNEDCHGCRYEAECVQTGTTPEYRAEKLLERAEPPILDAADFCREADKTYGPMLRSLATGESEPSTKNDPEE